MQRRCIFRLFILGFSVWLSAWPEHAAAIGFNIDYGGSHAGDQPMPDYGAAGTPGYWNGIGPDGSGELGPYELRDLAGAATDVQLSFSPYAKSVCGDLCGSLSVLGRDDGDARLLKDYVWGARETLISGLTPGDYRVSVYLASHRLDSLPGDHEVVASTSETISLAGIYFFDGLVEGSTHGSAVVTVSYSGELRVLPDSFGDHSLNGIQVVSIPEPVGLAGAMILSVPFLRRR